MKLGEIYCFVSEKAIGYQSRKKYHIYICESDWRDANVGHLFLFVSKADYGGDYPIKKSDYGFFDLEVSYVSCGRTIFYSDEELKQIKLEPLGSLNLGHLKELYSFVANSNTMERGKIKLVCEAIKPLLA